MELRGEVALVTGGNGGLRQRICHAQQGYAQRLQRGPHRIDGRVTPGAFSTIAARDEVRRSVSYPITLSTASATRRHLTIISSN